ncbi:hypothetical protein AB3N61_09280 [Leptospira sp. WS58.C1]|uniref:hypothetical protein n=1 Tax=Leptospira cinconiae TaxID=3235173 RepID=UPI00349EA441
MDFSKLQDIRRIVHYGVYQQGTNGATTFYTVAVPFHAIDINPSLKYRVNHLRITPEFGYDAGGNFENYEIIPLHMRFWLTNGNVGQVIAQYSSQITFSYSYKNIASNPALEFDKSDIYDAANFTLTNQFPSVTSNPNFLYMQSGDINMCLRTMRVPTISDFPLNFSQVWEKGPTPTRIQNYGVIGNNDLSFAFKAQNYNTLLFTPYGLKQRDFAAPPVDYKFSYAVEFDLEVYDI